MERDEDGRGAEWREDTRGGSGRWRGAESGDVGEGKRSMMGYRMHVAGSQVWEGR